MGLDREAYLQQRGARRAAELAAAGGREVCWACRRPHSTCLCAVVPPFDPGVQLVFLLHSEEDRKQRTGTGRLAHLALRGSRLFAGIDFSHHPQVEALATDPTVEPVLLFPGPAALDLSSLTQAPAAFRDRPLRVFVLDGTWALAPQILKRSLELQRLPRLSLTPGCRSRFAIKRQPFATALSTIEAVHCLLTELERLGLATPGGQQDRLLELLQRLVEIQERCRARSDGARHQVAKERRAQHRRAQGLPPPGGFREEPHGR